MASLVAKLSKCLGARQAAIEIKWMRQAAPAPHALQQMVDRRAQGEPLQYILGTQPFGPLSILVRPPTLIPRAETEQWTFELASKICRWTLPQRPLRILDLCTGSGCIPLLLCHLLRVRMSVPAIRTLGVDISPAACQLARENLLQCNTPPGYSLDFRQKNIFDEDMWEFINKAFQKPPLHHQDVLGKEDEVQLDVITANPPYIPKSEWLRLPPEVREWEDPLALLGDPHETAEIPEAKGLTFYKRIRDLLSLPDILSPCAIIAMEVGQGQAGDVARMFNGKFGPVEVWKDWWGKERAVFVHRKPPS